MTASPPIVTDRAQETAFLINDALRKGERHLSDARFWADAAITARGCTAILLNIRARRALRQYGAAVALRRRLELGL